MIAGDVVRTSDGTEVIVVDVIDDEEGEILVIRDHDDLQGKNLRATYTDEVFRVGHVNEVEGWAETEPGVWRKAE